MPRKENKKASSLIGIRSTCEIQQIIVVSEEHKTKGSLGILGSFSVFYTL